MKQRAHEISAGSVPRWDMKIRRSKERESGHFIISWDLFFFMCSTLILEVVYIVFSLYSENSQ